MLSPPSLRLPRTWNAELDLGFCKQGDRTLLVRRRHLGPLRVQRTFYPEGKESCHAYILHPPGGLVGGDTVEIKVECLEGSHALVTTPGAGKIYRTSHGPASLTQYLSVDVAARLEWLPQETILFDGCDARLTTRINLEQDARFIGWDLNCLGRPAAGEGFDIGIWWQNLEVWRQGVPVLLERARLTPASETYSASWGFGGRKVLGTMIVTPATPDLLEAARGAVAQDARVRLGLTLLGETMVCRYLGDQAHEARAALVGIWQAARPQVMGKPCHAPRIWSV